jgi:hypothetical protein
MADYLLEAAEKEGVNEYGAGGQVVIQMTDLWTVLMSGLETIWPATRTVIAGKAMGDVWPCSLLGKGEEGMVPFHKLMQWMAYSLVEVLERVGGWKVEGKEMLTGLPEYRGFLFLFCAALLNG